MKNGTKVKNIGIFTTIGIGWFLFASSSFAQEAPTVEGCVEKTGKTVAECTKMIENMKSMPNGDMGRGRGMMGGTPPNMKGGTPPNIEGGSFPQGRGGEERPPKDIFSRENNGDEIDTLIQKAEEWKTKELKMLNRIKKRIQKIINFLDSEDLETSEIEENLDEFSDKITVISNAFESYIEALNDDKTDGVASSDESIAARAKIKKLMKEMLDYYRGTVRENIKTQLDKLED